MQTNFIRASSRKEAILACRDVKAETIIETAKPHVFILTEGRVRILAVVTDVITGQGRENIFKVELDVYPN